MMIWYDHGFSGWGVVGMGIGMALFWALIIIGTIGLVRLAADNGRPSPPPMSLPEHEIATRFARGEISETEYRDRLAVLREHTRL